MKSDEVRTLTGRDPILGQVLQYTRNGWPVKTLKELTPFRNRKDELTVIQGCLLWGHRIVIPSKARKKLLQGLHEVHTGVARMKSLARQYFWWPNLDVRYGEVMLFMSIKSVCSCLYTNNSLAIPRRSLETDHAGPFMGKYFLVIIDAYSKRMEIEMVSSTSLKEAITKLDKIFASYGIPETMVSDNGSCFVSVEFKNFLAKCDI